MQKEADPQEKESPAAKIEFIVKGQTPVEAPIQVNYWTKVTDVDKCLKATFESMRVAVEQYNSGVTYSASLSKVDDNLEILKACGIDYEIKKEGKKNA